MPDDKVRSQAALLVAPFVLGFMLLRAQLDGNTKWQAPPSASRMPCGYAVKVELPAYLARPWDGKVTPDSALARGMTYQGSGEALARYARRLIDGSNSTLVWLGGSVTFGRGATKPELSYVERVRAWVEQSFPGNHTFVNNAISGTTSGLAASCIHQLVPENASLVVLEFSANDIKNLGLHHPQRAAFETLVRSLLNRPNPPALLLLHHWCWYVANKEANEKRRGLYDEPDTEFDLALIGQYYNVPSVSVKAAAWPLMMQRAAGFSPFGFGQDKFFVDPCHPSDTGHQVLADLVIHALQSAAARARQQQIADAAAATAAAAAAAAVLPSVQGQGQAAARTLAQQQEPEQQQQQLQAGQQQQEQGDDRDWIPPPLQESVTDDAPPALCMLRDDFEQAVGNASSGFKWAPDFPDAPTKAEQKWGWTGSQIGEWVELAIDTENLGKGGRAEEEGGGSTGNDGGAAEGPAGGGNATEVASSGSSGTTTVHLGYLRSYKDMGVGFLQCTQGCTCENAILDAHWDTRASLVQAQEFSVSQHHDCRIRVTIVARPQESINNTGEGAAGRMVLRSLVVSSTPLHLGGE